MSFKRQRQLAESPKWRKPLRHCFRRFYWKRERLAEKYEIKSQLRDLLLKSHEHGGINSGYDFPYP